MMKSLAGICLRGTIRGSGSWCFPYRIIKQERLFDEQGKAYVCEVNSNAHFKNIYDCTGVNAADFILEHIIKQQLQKGEDQA